MDGNAWYSAAPASRPNTNAPVALTRSVPQGYAPVVRSGRKAIQRSGFEETSEALKGVAAVLKDDSHAIQVEGHTDSVPIRNAFFPSNWELSSVRASSVVRLFSENGIAESRMSAVGKGPTQPVADNETAEGRLKNRRVTVIILSSLPAPVTEVPVGPGEKEESEKRDVELAAEGAAS